MSTFISRRFFAVTTLILVSFILFSTISFAQEAERRTVPIQQLRTTQVNQTQESVADRVTEKRSQMAETNTARKADFTQRVEEISDEAKKAAMARIANTLETMNEAKTTRWANILDTLSDILSRIDTNLTALEAQGADTTSANTLITTAEQAITNASEAVELQAGKVYEIEFTDEATLRQSVGPVVQQFKQDLRTTLASVISARDAVRQAARGLAEVSSINNENDATDSADTLL